MSAYVSVDVSSQDVGAECARCAEMLAEILNELDYRQCVGEFSPDGEWLEEFVAMLEPDAVKLLSALAKSAESGAPSADG